MIATFHPILHFQRALLDSALTASCQSLEGINRVRRLNLQVVKATVQEAGDKLSAALQTPPATRDANASEVDALPIHEKTRSYIHHLQTIATETGTELASVWEHQVAASGKALQAMTEAMATEAPTSAPTWFNWAGVAKEASRVQGYLPGLQPQVAAEVQAKDAPARKSRAGETRKAD